MDRQGEGARPQHGIPHWSLLSIPRRHFFVLSGMMAAYFVVSFLLSYLRVLEFTVSNWDLGIFQQALWTTSHGHVFFEAGDWEMWGSLSFLEVHPALILFLLAPVYHVAPSPITLLAIQSLAVAFAAVPLYQIGCRILARPGRALVVAGLYLAYAPVLTSNLYDFHLEAFLPLELFLLFLFWLDRRYVLGAISATAAFVTLEVAPFLVGAIAIYFLLSPQPTGGPYSAGRSPREPVPKGSGIRRFWGWLRSDPVRWNVMLLGVSILAYFLLRAFQWWALPSLLGPAPPLASGVGSLTGAASASGLGLSFSPSSHLMLKLGYWMMLIALLGFLPLFAPRAWILAVPWLFFTLQSNRVVWVQLGYQYGFLAAIPLVLAAIVGLRNIEQSGIPWLHAQAERRGRLRRVGAWLGVTRRGGAMRAGAAGLLIALIVLNVYMTPANPLQQDLESAQSAYRLSYFPDPGYGAASEVASLVGAGAPVLASDNLFPLVANSAQAYSLLWTTSQPTYLPFDARHPPSFVFLSSQQAFAVPDWLRLALANASEYGLLAQASSTPVGTVSLWEHDYRGPPTYFSAATAAHLGRVPVEFVAVVLTPPMLLLGVALFVPGCGGPGRRGSPP